MSRILLALPVLALIVWALLDLPVLTGLPETARLVLAMAVAFAGGAAARGLAARRGGAPPARPPTLEEIERRIAALPALKWGPPAD